MCGTVPLFIALTRGREPRERHRLAWQAALVALSWGVTSLSPCSAGRSWTTSACNCPPWKEPGGLLLLLVALELLTGKTSEPSEEECEKINVAFVPLGTALPWPAWRVSVATMLFVQRIHNGAQVVGFALVLGAVIVVLYLAMRFSGGGQDAEQLPPRHVGPNELAELGDHKRRGGVDRRCGVEHDIGTFQIAGESEQFPKQNAGIQVSRRLAQRCLSRRHRVCKLAGAQQCCRGLIGSAHVWLMREGLRVHCPLRSVTSWNAAEISSSW